MYSIIQVGARLSPTIAAFLYEAVDQGEEEEKGEAKGPGAGAVQPAPRLGSGAPCSSLCQIHVLHGPQRSLK